MRKAAVIFEGGAAPQNELDVQIAELRHAMTLDTVEKYLGAGLERVVLATNFPHLAAQARQLGAQIWETPDAASFHFGRELQRVVASVPADGVLYCSGAALPLIKPEEIQWVLTAMEAETPRVVVNNLQSVDLVAWNPAHYIQRVKPPESDNFLGWLLREQGMERVLIPNSAGIHFDLDTPTDYQILARSGQGGARTQAALQQLDWPMGRLADAADLLAADLPEVALIGRVGTPIIDHINKYLRVRLRVFSEERGMKALGRQAEGKVVSVMADFLEEMGPARFFRHLEGIASAVFFDTRVLFANRGRVVSDWDRFHSDLGRVDLITDPFVRSFTAAALSCRVPVVLGGHSVVSGGLWVLVDQAIARRGGPRVSQAKGFAPA